MEKKKKGLSVYEHRWNYIKRGFEAIKKLIDDGYLVYIGDERVDNLTINDKAILTHDDVTYQYFAENTKDLDAGLHNNIFEWNAFFRNAVKIYEPVPISMLWLTIIKVGEENEKRKSYDCGG